MTIVHLHLLLNHVPVVGTLFALFLFAAAILLREAVSTRFALGFSAAIAVVAVAVWTADLGGQIRHSEIRSANFQQGGSESED